MLAGCQLCPVASDHYMTAVDCVADKPPHLDRFYNPAFDLTRICYPDWCQCRFNRRLAGDLCRDCRVPPGYEHMPFYIPASPPAREPLPSAPPIPTQRDSSPETKVPDQLKPIPDPKQLEEGDALKPIPKLPPAPPVPQNPDAAK